MHRTRIKICGITRPEDAAAAAAAGADAVGMVFFPATARAVSTQTAREILAILPPFVMPIGLFVDQTTAEIREIASKLGLQSLQLHGNESPEQVAELAPFGVIKAIRADAITLGTELSRWKAAVKNIPLTNLMGIVLETPSTQYAGGTGIANNWATILRHKHAGDFAGLPPLIAAGGLTSESVGKVIGDMHPWGVDVSSGVESSKGVKSAAKIAAFVEQVCKADFLSS